MPSQVESYSSYATTPTSTTPASHTYAPQAKSTRQMQAEEAASDEDEDPIVEVEVVLHGMVGRGYEVVSVREGRNIRLRCD